MATQLLLRSLDVESPTLNTDETEWWLGASARLSAARDAITRAAASIWIGVKCAEGDRATIKYGARLMERELMAGLWLLESLVAADQTGGDRIKGLSDEIAEVRRDFDRIQASQTGGDAEVAGRHFERTADRLAANLREIETSALAIVAATVRPRAE